MKHMLANIQNYPIVPVFVLLLFFALFVSLLFMVFSKRSKSMYEEASIIPLSEKGDQNE